MKNNDNKVLIIFISILYYIIFNPYETTLFIILNLFPLRISNSKRGYE
jgi:hypothetical protein